MKESQLNIGIATTNPNFIHPVLEELAKHHSLHIWKPTDDGGLNMYMFGMMNRDLDGWFIDFAQTPLTPIWKFGKPVVVRMHRIEVYQFLWEDNDFEKMNWNNISIVFSCRHIAEKWFAFVDSLGNPKNLQLKSWDVIPSNMVDLKLFRPPETRERQERHQMCIVGRVIPKKRVYSLIQALCELPNWDLNIVGETQMSGNGLAEYKINCQDFIKEHGLEDRVHWIGGIAHDALPLFYQSQDIIVSNSNEEGTHVSIAEAMACGCMPLINAWKGADALYPKTSIFKNEHEFVRKVLLWEGSTDTDKDKESKFSVDFAREYFDKNVLSVKMREFMEGCFK